MDKTNYVLNKPEPAANETVWAFDLGKGSIGSPGGVAPVDEFPGVSRRYSTGRGGAARQRIFAQGIPAHPGGICRNQNRRRSPPDVAHAAGTRFISIFPAQ